MHRKDLQLLRLLHAILFVDCSFIDNILFQLQVYKMLDEDEQFCNCPWPIPPSAILLHLPIAEAKPKQTSEDILRYIISRDKQWRNFGNWDIRDVRPRPEWT